jgi:hypothetical protein
MLAAWLRQKYSHLIHGAISSSAPLKAKLDFFEYFEVVSNSLATYNNCDCVKEVKIAIQQLAAIIQLSNGPKSIAQNFNFCGTFGGRLSSLDISTIFGGFADIFASVVQHNQGVTIKHVCDIMCNLSVKSAPLRLVAANQMVMNYYGQSCFSYNYDKIISAMKRSLWTSKSAEGSRQWFYQTCTEFGFYQSLSNSSSVFGDKVPVEFYVQLCRDIFGQNFNQKSIAKAIDHKNIIFGALKPATTNVLFINGNIDPWHALGLTKTDRNQLQPTIFINGTSHCADMYEPSDNDLPQLKDARIKIARFIRNLLG